MLKNIFSKIRLKILVTLLISFFLIKELSPQVFIGQTPRINPFFVENLKNSPYLLATSVKELLQKPINFVASLTNFSRNNQPQTSQTSQSLPQNQQTREVPIHQNEDKDTYQSPQDVFANVQTVIPPSNLIFKTFSKNVSAAEDQQSGKIYLKIQKGAKYHIAGTIVINGKEYPKIEFINE